MKSTIADLRGEKEKAQEKEKFQTASGAKLKTAERVRRLSPGNLQEMSYTPGEHKGGT